MNTLRFLEIATQIMQTTFTTPRLSLSLVTEEDHAFIKALLNTKGWIEFIGDRHIHSEEDARNYIRKILSTPHLSYWVVRQITDQTPIGIISFLKRTYLEHFDIGFAFLPEYGGKGYAYEAANHVLTSILNSGEHKTVLATTYPHNRKSIALLEKLGMQLNGEIERDGDRLLVYEKKSVQ